MVETYFIETIGQDIKANFLSLKLRLFSYPSVFIYVVGTEKNCLNEMVLFSTHNICLG